MAGPQAELLLAVPPPSWPCYARPTDGGASAPYIANKAAHYLPVAFELNRVRPR